MALIRTIDASAWYETVRQADDVTLIHEPWIKPFYRCNMWHVRGRDFDLLFDTGLGAVPLRRSVPLLAGRPVICVASHAHFDHVGAMHEFAIRCIHCAEAGVLSRPDRRSTLADPYACDAMFDAAPSGWDAATYAVTAAPATRTLTDGDVIDLGDRAFTVLHVPGHSPGGIALWEARTGILLSGDVIYDGPLIDDGFGSDASAYATSVRRLAALPATIVHGGHFPSFGGTRLGQLADEYLAGRRQPGCPAPPGS
ncbi:MBL fold metallo-hydrolase [Zavarzinia sp. CC-PAN008]|uniref:MBL fold metallo-hydrolase n=1 Tax=Zavarzinia sp. CC-PAN008 TaxID=3243332 RepID=UPI003F744C8D